MPMPKRSLATVLLSTLLPATAFAVDADALLPVSPEIREILNARCVFCHGEIIDGEAEIREDLDMSTDEAIAETLADVEILHEFVHDDEMPQEGKLSFRLRRNPEMRARLNTLIEEYEASDEKAKLLAWIEAALESAE